MIERAKMAWELDGALAEEKYVVSDQDNDVVAIVYPMIDEDAPMAKRNASMIVAAPQDV